MNNVNYKNTSFSDKVMRRDFGKNDVVFSEPDLLKMQKESYGKFLGLPNYKKANEVSEIEALIGSYFPIKHAKNNKYEIRFKGINFAKPLRDEESCRNEGKTYEKALYVELSLVNNETGEVKDSKKSNKGIANGIFFANIPEMTDKGTFIINGIEKFVISQIVRAPGAYILNKSQIKLSNKKKINTGYICEMLPSKGTLLNFWIDEGDGTIKITLRNQTGDAAPSFPATQILKAFGMSQKDICSIFNDDLYIIQTLATEIYNHNNILEEKEDILKFRKEIDDQYNKIMKEDSNKSNSEIFEKIRNELKTSGSPIQLKLKNAVINYEENRKIFNEVDKQYQEILSTSENNATNKKLEELQSKRAKLLEKCTKELDVIITEKAAKDLVEGLSISTRTFESNSNVKDKENLICYQDVITSQFMDGRKYDLSSAGRYRTNRKMSISERLYQRILAKDIVSKDGEVLLKKGTLILKDELDVFKKAASENIIDFEREIHLNSITKSEKKNANFIESVLVYTDNNKTGDLDEMTPIIGESANATKSLSLTLVDFVCAMSYTINLSYGIGQYDDVDHLGNKRLRLIGEQLKSKLQIGMARVEKHVKDKLASISIATANAEQKAKTDSKTSVKTVVNTKSFQLVIKNFFNSYQLTQFIDQQNPLSELSNKRRISAMGDGGISREDPNLDIRDIHYSHYGRICPIETPEGMNIGLILSLASFTQVDDNGFLKTPYHPVKNGVISNDVEWLTALKEDEYVVGESTIPHDENGKITVDKAICRYRSNQQLYDVNKIDYIDISPRQVVSIAASAIPFLEHDDTTRALMGANMQRQAVPLIHPFAPIVGTGAEYKIAHDSGLAIIAKDNNNDLQTTSINSNIELGTVSAVDSSKIIIDKKEGGQIRYDLIKYRKSNQDTCINQTPIVNVGDKVNVGDTLTDGPAMYNGELALGRNPLVAFTTWNGYNYEDAIVISERLVHDDIYTSISIEEHTVKCIRTKNGDEEITRDLSTVSSDAIRYLNEDGIIMEGAEVKEGDVLVGKITPRGQSDLSPEEKLLQAIFGSKTKNYRESSLKVPHGGEGIVAKVQRFSVQNNDELDDDTIELIKIFIVQKRKIQIGDKMSGRHGNKGCISIVAPVADMPFLADGTPVDICLNPLGVPSRMNIGQVLEINLGLSMRRLAQQKAVEFALNAKDKDECVANYVQNFGLSLQKSKVLCDAMFDYIKQNNVNKAEDVSCNDVLVVLKNVGLDIEDLNYKAATPVFNGATTEDVIANLKEANYDVNNAKTLGKFQLYDGKTGDPFDGLNTVGVMYMLKLDHMVDDKIHARSVGPYSKITQQPLGGKSQNGGQRFGEMEVWALEAYGAAHNLQEILTIKSDDVHGRNRTHTAIVKGQNLPEPGLPETFKLLTKQLQGLCLDMEAICPDGKTVDLNSFTAVEDDEDSIAGDIEHTGIVSSNDFDNNNDEDDNY